MQLNGNIVNFDEDITISDLLRNYGYRKELVAVEVNLQIIPKEQFDSFLVKNSDTVEVVSFMGGG